MTMFSMSDDYVYQASFSFHCFEYFSTLVSLHLEVDIVKVGCGVFE